MDIEKMLKKWETMSFVRDQINNLSLSGAREEMRKFIKSKTSVLKYIKKNEKRAQAMLDYVCFLNDLGIAHKENLLDEGILFKMLMPKAFFMVHWKRLFPLIKQERERRDTSNLYGFAEGIVLAAQQYLDRKEVKVTPPN